MTEQADNLRLEQARFYTLPPKALILRWAGVVLPVAVLLYQLSDHYFLFYHSLVELFFISVAFTIFSIGWNSRHIVPSNSLTILAVGHLALCAIQLFHLTSYKGLGILAVGDANPATQLWIAARYFEALVFLAAALTLPQRKRIPPYLLLSVALVISALLLTLIWPLKLFPDCFLAESGLTRFKVESEYLICLMFGAAMFLFWRRSPHLDRRYRVLLLSSIAMSILTELAFTLYHDLYGFTNFLGHFFKLLAVTFLYRALISNALRTPYTVLFGDLSRAKEALDRELEQRRRTELELREANRELDAFVHTVSHDLRSPLTPIIGLAGILQERLASRLEREDLEALQAIEGQGQRMSRILSDLLAFARAGHSPLEKLDTASLDDTLDRVLEDLGSRIIAAQVEIRRTPLPNLPYPRTWIFQVLSNLISNALKYAATPEGIIDISGGLDSGGQLRLRVADHGPGIPASERTQIFELFHRQACHAGQEGSGIGLATVKKIIERLDGQVHIEATPGGGATFVIELPPFRS